MRDKPVYSTATPHAAKPKAKESSKQGAYAPSAGPMKMRLETKGRGGKAVTVLFNLTFPHEAEALSVMKELQNSLGCGATCKDSTLEFRGDVRDRVQAYFTARGVKLVRAGG